MLTRFLPQTVPFFKLLMEQNAVLQRMAQSLIVVMENTYESEGHLKQINILEEEADKLNRKITWHLSQTFITPIDREDIHAINLAQERVADGIQTVSYTHLSSTATSSAPVKLRCAKSGLTSRWWACSATTASCGPSRRCVP